MRLLARLKAPSTKASVRETPGRSCFFWTISLLATFLSEHELIREHKGEEVVEKTMSFWERLTNLLPWGNFGINLARMLMDVVDPQKAIEAGSKAIEAGSDVVDKL
jgi:hypothetical protein